MFGVHAHVRGPSKLQTLSRGRARGLGVLGEATEERVDTLEETLAVEADPEQGRPSQLLTDLTARFILTRGRRLVWVGQSTRPHAGSATRAALKRLWPWRVRLST